jgi:hypothetical protein
MESEHQASEHNLAQFIGARVSLWNSKVRDADHF